jgi:anti-sigma factor RsiW
MKHARYDQDILMHAHGLLSPAAQMRTQLHLIACADCRSRLAQLQATSGMVAAAVRGPDLPRWRPANAANAGSQIGPSALTVWIVALVLITGLIVGVIHARFSQPRFQPIMSQPCAPGLPNDHCQ